MNNYGNKLRTQLDKLENNIDLVQVKQTMIHRGEYYGYRRYGQNRCLSQGILENYDGRRRQRPKDEEKKVVRFNICEEDERDRERRENKKRILRSRKIERKPIMKIRLRLL